MVIVFLATLSTNPQGTLQMEWNQWQQAPLYSFWDLHNDGVVDIRELLVFTQTTFIDVTVPAGANYSHSLMVGDDYLTAGMAWGDVDNDTWLDLYLTNANGPNTLLMNNGDGTFSADLANPMVSLPLVPSGGATFVDVNNDGWMDLYVLNHGMNRLFINNAGLFSDATASSGTGDLGRGQSAAWGDLDLDGDLDLYVVNWGQTGNWEDALFRNNNDGTFTDITAATLTTAINKPGFAASFVDFNNDSWPDLYVVNDKSAANVLWRNQGPGCASNCFLDISVSSNSNTLVDGMGLATGDYDWDGDLDFYFSNTGPMVLLENQVAQGTETFIDQSVALGVAFDCIGWGACFYDYDNDGFLDLALAVMDNDPYKANRMFHNMAGMGFQDVSYRCGVANQFASIGISYADYNRDGYLDQIVGNYGSGFALYRNTGKEAQGNQWVSFSLRGTGPINANAIGARVVLTTATKSMMQEVKCGSSIGSNNQLELHFGLGTESMTSALVIWPDQTIQPIPAPLLNTINQVVYSSP
ncbi:MAG: CRTAC1 family protein [Acidobacteria bacterium]|nr:CRTAC1 family protein [Acidobacteriota bacterium]